MNWDAEYVLTGALTLQVSTSRKLIGTNSVSRPPQEVNPDAVPVMMAFARPTTPRTALQWLNNQWEADSQGFEAVVARLIALNFLTPHRRHRSRDVAAPALADAGFASLVAHHHMLRDTMRVLAYKVAISRHARGKHVIDLGCGTGVLAVFAAKAGARRVTAIEESTIAAVARQMIEVNQCQKRIDLRLGNSRDIRLSKPADLLVHEIIGIDPFMENVLPYIADARDRLLAKGGRLVPYRLEVFCIGFEVEDRPYRDQARHLAEAAEFGRLYGLDFAPFERAIGNLSPRVFRRPIDLGDTSGFIPKVLTEECRLYDISLYDNWTTLSGALPNVALKVRRSGLLGGVLLYFRAHLDEVTQVMNSPFVPLTSWGRDVRPLSKLVPVTAGDQVPMSVSLALVFGRYRVQVDLKSDRGSANKPNSARHQTRQS